MAEPLPHLEDLSPDYVGFNQGRVIYSWMAVMAAMATCAVGLRVWARRERDAELRLDDWLIFAALVGLLRISLSDRSPINTEYSPFFGPSRHAGC